MEQRTNNLTEDMKSAGMEAKEMASERAKDLTARARHAKDAAVDGAKAAYQAAQVKARAGAKATDQAIHDYPYASLGISFAAGMLLGVILKRR